MRFGDQRDEAMTLGLDEHVATRAPGPTPGGSGCKKVAQGISVQGTHRVLGELEGQ